MPSLLDELKRAYIDFGIKTVTKTDVEKAAYIPNAAQYSTLASAGYSPKLHTNPTVVPIRAVGTDAVYQTTYYNAIRQAIGRAPETRMGRGLIRLIKQGDQLLLGTDGVNVFARVISSADVASQRPPEAEQAIERAYEQLDTKRLFARAKQATAKPPRTAVTVQQFVRDAAVREFVMRRCQGKCEVPGCDWKGFEKEDGTLYMEVHHIKFLSQGGDDTIFNTAGICSNCHSKAHYGKNRDAFAAKLLKTVDAATRAFEKTI